MNKKRQIKDCLDEAQNLLLMSYAALTEEQKKTPEGKLLLGFGIDSALVEKQSIPLALDFLENEVYRDDSVEQYKELLELVKKYSVFFPTFEQANSNLEEIVHLRKQGLLFSSEHPWRDIGFIVHKAIEGLGLKSVISILNPELDEKTSTPIELESELQRVFKKFNYPIRSALSMRSHNILNYLLSLPECQNNLIETYGFVDEKLKEIFCSKVYSKEDERLVPDVVSGAGADRAVLKHLVVAVPEHGTFSDNKDAERFVSTHHLTKVLKGFGNLDEEVDEKDTADFDLNMKKSTNGQEDVESEIALFKSNIESPFFDLINVMSEGLQSSNEHSVQNSALYCVRGLKEFSSYLQRSESLELAQIMLSNEIQMMKLSAPSADFLESIDIEDGQNYKKFCSLELRLTIYILKHLSGSEVSKETAVELEPLWNSLPMVKDLKLSPPKLAKDFALSDIVICYALALSQIEKEKYQFLDEQSQKLIVSLNKLIPKILNTSLVREAMIDFQLLLLEKSRNFVPVSYGLDEENANLGRGRVFKTARVKVFEALLNASSKCKEKSAKSDSVVERVRALRESPEKYISLSAAFSVLFSPKREFLDWESNDEVVVRTILKRTDVLVEKLSKEVNTAKVKMREDSRDFRSVCDMLELLVEFKNVSTNSFWKFNVVPGFVKQELTEMAVKINFNERALIGNGAAKTLNERFQYVISALEEPAVVKPLRL